MIINDNRIKKEKNPRFCECNVGECFEYQDNIFVKIMNDDGCYCGLPLLETNHANPFDLVDNDYPDFEGTNPIVKPVKVTLTIE